MEKSYVVFTYEELTGRVQDFEVFFDKQEAEEEQARRQQLFDDERLFCTALMKESV